jgi:hypothetical protein
MDNIVSVLVVFGLGLLFGVAIMRYAMGLHIKYFYQIKEDFPAFQYGKPIEQDLTGDEEVE